MGLTKARLLKHDLPVHSFFVTSDMLSSFFQRQLWQTKPKKVGFVNCEGSKEGKSAINLSNLGKFCQIWPRAIYLC